MLKLINLCLFLLFFLNETHSQNQAQQKIIQAIGFEQFQLLQTHHPDSLKLLELLVEDGFSIIKKDYVTEVNAQNLPSISLPLEVFENGIPQKTKINILTLPVTIDQNQSAYYQIVDSEYILKIKSLSYIDKKFKSKPIK